MIGIFLVVIGLLLLWVAVRGKSSNLLSALSLDTVSENINKNLSDTLNQWLWQPLGQTLGGLNPFGNTTNTTMQPGSSNVPPSNQDTGVHMGIDASGNTITIRKTYAQMTQAEKAAANLFARLHPSGERVQ